MKEIKIFLASSIDEFKNERNELQCFIDDVAEDFRDRYDTDIRVQRCEKVDPRYVKGRSQDEFNELIKNSEMCIFLFFTKAGEYTIEEFEVARKAFETSENGRPKIYTYFKTIDDVSVEKSVTDFMGELDKNLKHFYQTFSHIDTVKLRVLLNLKLQEMEFVSVTFEDGKCIVDGKETLELSNVSEFANNSILRDLNAELEKTEKEYFELKPLYVSGQADDSVCKRYADIASKRQNLIDQIEELQKSIFNISLRMCNDEVHGEITQRQKEAYCLFELGDLDGCMSVLNSKDIDDDFLRAEKHLEEMAKKNAVKYIREHKTAIDILETMMNYKNRFNEIEERYEKIVPVAEKYLVEVDVIYDYCSLLDDQNKSPKAYELAKRLERLYLLNKNKFEESDFADLYNLLGIICGHLSSSLGYKNVRIYNEYQGNTKEAEYYFERAIEIRNQLVAENSERYNASLARCYSNASSFYRNLGDMKRAECYCVKSLKIKEQLALDNPKKYGADLAGGYNNVGIIYYTKNDTENAEHYYTKALEMYKKISKENPGKYDTDLAIVYNNLGAFYDAKNNIEQADSYYRKAIAIYNQLASKNPERYGIDLAVSRLSHGMFTYKITAAKKNKSE